MRRAFAAVALSAWLPMNGAYLLGAPGASLTLWNVRVRPLQAHRVARPFAFPGWKMQKQQDDAMVEAFSYEGFDKNPVALDPAGN